MEQLLYLLNGMTYSTSRMLNFFKISLGLAYLKDLYLSLCLVEAIDSNEI